MPRAFLITPVALHRPCHAQVADKCGDPAFTDFIETFLGDQLNAIRDVGERVSQLERLAPGGGHAVWHWDEVRD